MEVLAIDIGYGLTKGMRGDRTQVFPSLLAKQDDQGAWPASAEIEFQGQRYLVGDPARLSPLHFGTLHGSRSQSLEYRLLAMAMMAELCPERKMTVAIVTGLPVSHMSADRATVSQQLSGVHKFRYHDKDYAITVKAVHVIPQPLGTFRVINHEGLANQTIGVVDIGFYTTDFILFRNQAVIPDSSGSVSIGCHTICQMVRDGLYRDSGIDLDIWSTESSLRAGSITRMSKTYDLSPYIQEGGRRFLDLVRSHMTRLWGNQVERVFWSGGGAVLVQTALLPTDGEIIPDPQTANVRGYALWGHYLTKQPATKAKPVISPSSPERSPSVDPVPAVESTGSVGGADASTVAGIPLGS